MSIFRSPLYLDTEILVPMANYHDIEVMVDIAVTQRDLGQRSGSAAIEVAVPIPGTPRLELGGSKGSEVEVTQARTVKDHPANALNRLLDALAKSGDVTCDLSAGAIMRRQLVELEGDWEISPATDIGSLLAGMVSMVAQKPSLLKRAGPPPELYSLVASGPTRGSVVLRTTLNDAKMDVLILLDSGCLMGQAGLDDLEGDRTVFGQVDTVVDEGSHYSLDKFFLSGISRSIRRTISLGQMLQGLATVSGRPMTSDDLKVDGPVVVIKAIAIY